MIGKLIGLVLGCVVVGALAGTAVTAILDVNTTTWGDPEAALWLILPVVVVIGIVVLIIKEAGIEF